MKRKLFVVPIISALSVLIAVQSFAAWEVDEHGYKWKKDDGTYACNEEFVIDEDDDGVAERWAFDSNGYAKTSGLTSSRSKIEIEGHYIQTEYGLHLNVCPYTLDDLGNDYYKYNDQYINAIFKRNKDFFRRDFLNNSTRVYRYSTGEAFGEGQRLSSTQIFIKDISKQNFSNEQEIERYFDEHASSQLKGASIGGERGYTIKSTEIIDNDCVLTKKYTMSDGTTAYASLVAYNQTRAIIAFCIMNDYYDNTEIFKLFESLKASEAFVAIAGATIQR